MTLTLNTLNRKTGEKRTGFLPAILYAKGFDNKSVFIAENDFIKIFRQAGESSIINLTGDVNESVFVCDLQRDPVSYTPSHVDFKVVVKGQKVHVNVPINFVGEAPVMKLGANLVKVIHELPVEADSDNIPSQIDVDLSKLVDLNSNITVSDIVLPKGVSLYHIHSEDIIVSVVAQSEENLSNPVSQVDMNSVGASLEKGKKEAEE